MFKLFSLISVNFIIILLSTIFTQKFFFTLVDDQSGLVKIRGFSDDVNRAFKTLSELVKELDETNYVKEIPFIKDVHKFVIGKGGANIKKVIHYYNAII